MRKMLIGTVTLGAVVGVAAMAAVIKSDLPRRIAARLEDISVGLINAEPDEDTVAEQPANGEPEDLNAEQSDAETVVDFVELADEIDELPER